MKITQKKKWIFIKSAWLDTPQQTYSFFSEIPKPPKHVKIVGVEL